MKAISTAFILLFAMTSQAQDLSKFKWKNRILLFSTSSLTNETFKKQWEAFKESPKKIADRNVLTFALVKGRIYDSDLNPLHKLNVAEIRKRYKLQPTYEGFILIGKDGGSKMRSPYFTEPKNVFQYIDQMPMRKQEMRENFDN